MIHFTCDLCGKSLSAANSRRYVVKIEAFPSFDQNQITEDDLDEDHLEAVAKLLQEDSQFPETSEEAEGFKGFRFDMCPECHREYLKDPLGKDLFRNLDFSVN